VDEVLAVGDAQFQKKCLGKMGEVAKGGRTVLFVSHNMGAIANLCNKAVVMRQGQVHYAGSVDNAVNRYLDTPAGAGEVDLSSVKDRIGNGRARFIRAITRNSAGLVTESFTIGEDLIFEVHIQSYIPIRSVWMSLKISSGSGVSIYHFHNQDASFPIEDLNGPAVIRIVVPKQKLYPNTYFVNFWLADTSHEPIDYIINGLTFTVADGGALVRRPLISAAGIVHEIPQWTRKS
jgi:lipopolysaccharide transport system ATP-binding protein